ncbi:MAG TPA: UDP-N-acetylglucosamine pyrophosphorylase [Clostridiales bacterium]|nr:UDP-N-acetylglucosamine pyrophosphorylase [Clostridiales bacterium]
MDISVKDLLDINECDAKDIFNHVVYPWDVLIKIKDFLLSYSLTLPKDFERIEEFVWVGKGTTIEKTALIKGPAIIGHNCEIRHASYIRENVIIGNNVVVGNSTEIKNAILFNKVHVPHYNYIGDSILGYKAHLGAGVILSNFKSDGGLIKVKTDSQVIETGLRKLGAIIGDYAEIGCNSVLNPGTIVGRNSIVYPLSSVRGILQENSILKGSGNVVTKH